MPDGKTDTYTKLKFNIDITLSNQYQIYGHYQINIGYMDIGKLCSKIYCRIVNPYKKQSHFFDLVRLGDGDFETLGVASFIVTSFLVTFFLPRGFLCSLLVISPISAELADGDATFLCLP